MMDNRDRLDELKDLAVDNYFRFRDMISPYLEEPPASFAELDTVEQQPADPE